MDPWTQITQAQIEALAATATALDLPTLSGNGWTYDVGPTNWLTTPDGWAVPGVLNKIRRDLRVVLEEIDPVFGTRGWPEGCICSGPWVLPPGSLAAVPGTSPGWVGVQTGAAGTYAFLREVRCFAWEEILTLVARGDVAHTTLWSFDGGGTAVLDRGWSGTYSTSSPVGWTQLTFTCAFSLTASVVGFEDGADGFVYVDIATDLTVDGGSPQFTATLNGSAATVVKTGPSGGIYRYAVDVTAAASGTSLEVAFSWPTTEAAAAWGASFSARHEYSATTEDAVLAETGWIADASQDFRVTGAGDWQIADTWVWPEFSDDDDRGTEQFCFLAKTLPATMVRYDDAGLDSPNLTTQWTAAAVGYRPACPSAPMQRSDQGNADGTADAFGRLRDGLANGSGEPNFILPTSPTISRCAMVPGVWVCRRGLPVWTHAPFLPDVAADDAGRPDMGDEVTVGLGVWRGGEHDGDLPRTWTGGTFDEVTSVVLGPKTGYAYYPFALPWPALENKAVVWEADPDVVEVTAPVVCLVTLPVSGLDGWDVGWAGQQAAGIGADGGAADDFPATANDDSDPWIDCPPTAYSSAMSVAILNDTSALLALVPVP